MSLVRMDLLYKFKYIFRHLNNKKNEQSTIIDDNGGFLNNYSRHPIFSRNKYIMLLTTIGLGGGVHSFHDNIS
jgi:hypothetical protein